MHLRDACFSAEVPVKLETFVVGWPMPEQQLDRFRADFPDVEFIRAESEDLGSALGEADAVISWRLTPAELSAAPRLKWLQTVGAGIDDVVSPELIERGIIVTNNSGVHASNISEHVLAMMLAFARRLPLQIRGQIVHEWRDDVGRQGVFELGGQNLLVAGAGDIGRALAIRARALGMKTIGIRRRTTLTAPEEFDEVYGVEELAQHLPAADHVVITLPLTNKTRGLFGDSMLQSMKQGSYIYNIGRGPIIDSQSLISHLQKGHLAGAGLDVTDPEPLPPDSPLWDMENVIITSHTSGATPNYLERATGILHENIRRFLADEPMMNVVDLTEGY
jgi:phosphoglycerate dehydrogenase-like enzyme